MIYRYTSKLIVVCHSWQSKTPIELSRDVVSCVTKKRLKGVGTATVVVAPRENLFNRLYANDIINIYYDPGDGVTGWTRIFFGFIDRVARNEQAIGASGAVATGFTISCSDFMKSIDRSQVIFKNELVQRTDWSLDARFFFGNLGGLGTTLRGLSMTGTPDGVVESILGTFMGYGGQFQLPESYGPSAKAQKRRQRARRQQTALLRIPRNVQDAVRRAGFGDLFGVNEVVNPVARLKALLALISKNSKKSELSAAQMADYASIRASSLHLITYANVMEDVQGQPSSMYDILDSSFIEGLCIDGKGQTMPLHQNVGALSNICYRWGNCDINELFFDLRPCAEDSNDTADSMLGGDTESSEVRYDRARDDLKINVDGFGSMGPSSAPGVRYVPAIVMREHPYSTARSADMSKYLALGLKGQPIGAVPLGPVFAQPRVSSDPTARVLYDYGEDGFANGITSERRWYPEDAAPIKHLDVSVMRLDEMASMDVSRGDADAVNLIIFSQIAGPTGTKYNVPDIIPIFNLASIARDGVRLREAETPYAGWTNNGDDSNSRLLVAFGTYRWCLLQDHWYQHNPEYLSGSIESRPRPDIRVGYRLDIPERMESYYVEEVEHNFSITAEGAVRGGSRFQIARGQRTDPFPVYILPSVNTARVGIDMEAATAFGDDAATALLSGGGNRTNTGRLGRFFPIADAEATVSARGRADNAGATRNTTDADPASGTGFYVAAYPSDGVGRR